jgi:adenylate cyclase
MPVEIERKFLVKDDSWKISAKGTKYIQGYLSKEKDSTIRIRIAGDEAFITIKSKVVGFSRQEYEYEIPISDAKDILDRMCFKPLIIKTRYQIKYQGNTWEVDVFDGDNEGLILAEIELSSETQNFEKPSWIGEEVTGDIRYYNSNLVNNPYKNWK